MMDIVSFLQFFDLPIIFGYETSAKFRATNAFGIKFIDLRENGSIINGDLFSRVDISRSKPNNLRKNLDVWIATVINVIKVIFLHYTGIIGD